MNVSMDVSMDVSIDVSIDVSRKTLMSRVQVSSDEIVCWIDCGFYLMPITSSKLSQYGLSWNDIKVVNPLDLECEKDPVFESTEMPVFEKNEKTETKESCIRKHYRNFPCNLSHSMFPRLFFSAFM